MTDLDIREEAAAPVRDRGFWRRSPRSADDEAVRSAVSWGDRHDPRVRWTLRVVQILVFVGLVVAAVFPMIWLAKASISTTADLIRDPLGWWPSGVDFSNYAVVWNELGIYKYLLNTLWLALGSAAVTLVVCITGAYCLSILRPRWGAVVYWAVLATLFIPGVISLVPLYLTVLDLPGLGISLLNTMWAVWLPAGASAFSLVLAKRFFDSIPRELIEAARIDGAGPVRVLWSIVIPLSRPIISVLALLSCVSAYKEYLWPLLVLPDPEVQPISVALPRVEPSLEYSAMMAALFLSLLVPIVLFLIFQRQFLRSVGMANGIKG
ncbi:carbohydrate ABC transporter permease [Herbiconiux sp. A18JL235]|uniref:Carbohydrate ABC transporter permease n=1 Tax=Herbiconiux sp. A18JL235 TaxID=3152363 RepID=A0AB39BEA2_9MICO